MYPLVLHPTYTPEKWATHPPSQQILMIANEMNRLKNGIHAHQPKSILGETMERLFELVDLTVECARSSLRQELLRWRELLGEIYLRDEEALWNSGEEVEALLKVLLFMTKDSSTVV